MTNAIYRAAVAVGGRDRSIAEELTAQVVAILEENTAPGHIPHVEEIQDIVEKVLIEAGHARTAKAYILYRAEQARRRGEKSVRSQRGAGNIPYRKVYEVLNWAVDHCLHTVGHLNERIAGGEFPDMVRESEEAYEGDVTTAAEMIRERQGEVKIVIVAGPSSSGKTTTTIKLSERLAAAGLSLVALNVDNYFFDLELHPKDEFGDYDFETPQALDLPLINEHLVRLLAGEEVKIPFYDFKTGKRTDGVTPMRVGPRDIILIDSLHGLYADMTRDIADERKFRLYIETLLQMKDDQGEFIRWTDLRLMRRMVRDAQFRGYDPEQTLLHWHYVRSSELRNIIPHVNAADYIVNSGLPYELPIMKARLMDHFEQWAEKYADDPQRVDACIRSTRVRELLRPITAVEDDAPIPPHSLLREFIGGSCYEY
ncbi:MAG: response regulator SirA [Chloroflexi bacterium]|nr:response regulator SirA [Chloroflexota bacterium]